MKRSSLRIDSVDTPIIPTVAALVRDNPGTISLGQGVVRYGPPADLIRALPERMADSLLHRYQAVGGITPLIEAIAGKLRDENGIEPARGLQIMVTAGSNMAFLNTVLALGDPGDEFILPLPFYFNQEMAIRMAGCIPVGVPTLPSYQLDLAALERAITPRTRAIITVSPNNPTGAVYPEAASTTSVTRPTSTSPSMARVIFRQPRFRVPNATRSPSSRFRKAGAWRAGAVAMSSIRPIWPKR